MRGASIIAAIFVLISHNANAYEFEKVIVRPSDNKIEDISGKVVAVPNPDDPKNTQYEKFYRDAEKKCEGKPCPSDFSIIYHPNFGYIKNPKEAIESMMKENQGEAEQNEGSVQEQINPYHSEPDMRARY